MNLIPFSSEKIYGGGAYLSLLQNRVKKKKCWFFLVFYLRVFLVMISLLKIGGQENSILSSGIRFVKF